MTQGQCASALKRWASYGRNPVPQLLRYIILRNGAEHLLKCRFLFGNILAISPSDVRFVIAFACLTLAAVGVLYRPLLFASVDPEIAEARGLPVRGLGIGFMVLLGFAVATAVQVVGVLLIFALLILPSASAQQLTARPAQAILYAVAIAIVCVWLGLAIGFYLPYPPSFFITTLTFVSYLVTRQLGPSRLSRGRQSGSSAGVHDTAVLVIPPTAPVH